MLDCPLYPVSSQKVGYLDPAAIPLETRQCVDDHHVISSFNSTMAYYQRSLQARLDPSYKTKQHSYIFLTSSYTIALPLYKQVTKAPRTQVLTAGCQAHPSRTAYPASYHCAHSVFRPHLPWPKSYKIPSHLHQIIPPLIER